MNRRSVAFVWANVGPYHDARMSELVRQRVGKITCIELTSRPALRPWGRPGRRPYNLISLSNQREGEVRPRALGGGMSHALDQCTPEAVFIAGYSLAPMRDAFRWASRHRIPAILMSDSTGLDRPRRFIREQLKGWWIRRHVAAALVSGIRAASYVKSLGVPEGSIWKMMDVVDNAYFAGVSSSVRRRRTLWRSRLARAKHYALYAGRISPEKNVEVLIEAYVRYRAMAGSRAWDLLLVGDGPGAVPLKTRYATQPGLAWIGFQSQRRLAEYYGLAECLLLPSRTESWGLVVNEAMASGLPVIVSNVCGCIPELVTHGTTGFVCDPARPQEFANALWSLHGSSAKRRQMGRAACRRVSSFGLSAWGSNVRGALDEVLAR